MSQSDSLLVEQRSRYSVLVIDGDQLSGCNALEALRGMGVTWVTSLEDAMLVANQKKFDFILASPRVSEERGGKLCDLPGEITALAYRHHAPICFISCTDEDGRSVERPDHLTFQAASTENLADSMIAIGRNGKPQGKLLEGLRFTCTYTMPGEARTPNIWLKGLEMLQAMCMKPKVEMRPPKADGHRPTPIPRK